MTTLYNKTALKKIKKNDLITMFLDLQARDYDSRIGDEGTKELKEELGAKDIALDIIKQENEVNKKNMFRFMKETKGLKSANVFLKETTDIAWRQIEELKEGQYKLDRDLVDMVWDPLMKAGFTIRHPGSPITDHLKILIDDYKAIKEENEKLKADITIHPDYERLVELN